MKKRVARILLGAVLASAQLCEAAEPPAWVAGVTQECQTPVRDYLRAATASGAIREGAVQVKEGSSGQIRCAVLYPQYRAAENRYVRELALYLATGQKGRWARIDGRWGEPDGEAVLNLVTNGRVEFVFRNTGVKECCGVPRKLVIYELQPAGGDGLQRVRTNFAETVPVIHGDSLEEVQAAYGISRSPEPGFHNDPMELRFKEYGVTVVFDKAMKVHHCWAMRPFKGSVSGIRIGDSTETLEQRLGEPSSKGRHGDYYVYLSLKSGRGLIRFGIEDGKVSSITW